MEARRTNLQQEAIYMHHAYTGGPLLRQGALDQPQRDRARYEQMKEDHADWWLN